MARKTDVNKKALEVHRKHQGKIEITARTPLKKQEDLSVLYTPGVAEVSRAIAKNKKKKGEYTLAGRLVGVITNGSAVLGLGNIGPDASLPVMEGKALIFKEFAGIDAIPVALDVASTDEFIAAVKAIAPNFAGINLEDIKAPECFEIEERLKKELPIPVMHDDQHGTAIVVLAGLINAAKVVGKDVKKLKVAITGAGAAGTAVANLFLKYGIKDIVVLDSKGALSSKRKDLNEAKQQLATRTNPRDISGGVREALADADVVVGVSGPKTIAQKDIEAMAENPVVFALANPTPEIMPDVAKRGGAAVIATGRSDFPNQVNNSLAFPGVFRGALDAGVRDITDAMKIRAAEALAALVKKPTAERIIPGAWDKGVVQAVAKAVSAKSSK